MLINDFSPAEWGVIFARLEPLLPGFYQRHGPPHGGLRAGPSVVNLEWYEPVLPTTPYDFRRVLSVRRVGAACYVRVFSGPNLPGKRGDVFEEGSLAECLGESMLSRPKALASYAECYEYLEGIDFFSRPAEAVVIATEGFTLDTQDRLPPRMGTFCDA